MNIIVNADDFGISEQVNREILNLIAHNRITSTTIMANSAYLKNIADYTKKYPHISFGIHLNLTSFSPLSQSQKIQPLLNEKGYFHGKIRAIKIDASLREGIFTEWCAQIENLIRLGVFPSHIDSHHHVHTIPNLFQILKRVQKKYGIRRVRSTRNLYKDKIIRSNIFLQKKKLFNFMLKNYYRTKTTDIFTDLSTFIEIGKMKKIQGQSAELMVHPGDETEKSQNELLSTTWQDHLCFETKMISYKDL